MSLLRASLEALKSAPTDPSGHQRNVALGFTQSFAQFASEICGCESAGDRVKLRKSVFHQTVGLKLVDFVCSNKKQPPHLLEPLTVLGRMECPVSLAGDESSPSKLIMASKILRSHLELPEATTCRGCSKRGKCSFARKPLTSHKPKTSLGVLAKVLFGISQVCMQHLADPVKVPLVISPVELESALQVLVELTEHLRPAAAERQLSSLSVADRKAVKRILKNQLEKKIAKEHKRKSQVPAWMGLELAAENKPALSVDSGDLSSESGWIEEGTALPELKFQEIGACKKIFAKKVSLDAVADIPVPSRFVSFEKRESRKREGGSVGMKMSDILKSPPSNDLPNLIGGYTTGGYTTALSVGVEYIKPNFLRGKTVLDNVSVANKLWNSSQDIIELKFLKRVPFVTEVPPADPVRADPHLARTLESKAKLTIPKPPGSRRVRLLDKRVDFEGADVSLRNSEIETAAPHGGLRNVKIGSNAETLAFALAAESPGVSDSKLQFPKLPQWEVPKAPPTSAFSHLMRPARK